MLFLRMPHLGGPARVAGGLCVCVFKHVYMSHPALIHQPLYRIAHTVHTTRVQTLPPERSRVPKPDAPQSMSIRTFTDLPTIVLYGLQQSPECTVLGQFFPALLH